MPERRRTPVDLAPPDAANVRLGHNGGPPLDMSWQAWLWRRAHAEAWRPPSRDVAMHRLRRAERLGLDYRTYTSVLMDRGVHLGAAVFAFDRIDPRQAPVIATRISGLQDCPTLLCASAPAKRLLSPVRESIDAGDSGPDIVKAVDKFIVDNQLVPSAVFMVGTTSTHLRAAEDCSLALFTWAADYFAFPGA